MKETHLSDSLVQREIEKKVVSKLEIIYSCKFSKTRENSKFEFDFLNEEKKIIGEIYAGIDKLSPAQKKKVITDCFKLIAAEKKFDEKWNKYIVFIDEKIKAAFEGNSWISEAIEEFGIELKIIDLSPEDESKLREAKKKQQLGNQMKWVK